MSGEKIVRVEEEEEKVREEEGSGGTESRGAGGGGEMKGLMRWEKFLPKMVLRVLLVEADDCTRQIITALLRKCNYKVAAVADGLKAWEILKGRPRSIDLILTEVDLPAISGYALLTLIMEHDICKSIPVIMMSSQDSVSTVYKCMLRGAADYLVKPIRINELRNLWQHVWRRQTQSAATAGINGPQDESDTQQKFEATAENNAASNRSGGDAACIQRNKDLIEKGSDAQSSCTRPNMEAESGLVDNMHEFSQLKCAEAYPSEIKTRELDIHLGQAVIAQDSHAGGLSVANCNNGVASTNNCKNGETGANNCKDGDDQEHFRNASISGEVHDNHYVQIYSTTKEAIDLIGAFRTDPNCSLKNSSIDCTGKFDHSPQLDLSLRSSHPSNFEKDLTEERHTLMHSNASAFKRYTNRQLQASPAVVINFSDQPREQKTNNENHNSDSSIPSMQKESELATSHSQQRHSLPIPVKGVRFNDLCMAYGSTLPPGFRTQSGPPSMPGSVVFLEQNFQADAFYQSNVKQNNSEQLYEPRGPNGNSTPNQIMYTQEHKSEHPEDQRLISPTTDQSVSSSFCNNGNASNFNSIGYGSNCGSSGNVEQVATFRTAAVSEGKNEELTNSGYSHRAMLREAALNKFRLKRKERCYEKKVRYESRKKLAEQRPRVKGQFVRQPNPDSLSGEKDC